jgi:O-antigen ligase
MAIDLTFLGNTWRKAFDGLNPDGKLCLFGLGFATYQAVLRRPEPLLFGRSHGVNAFALAFDGLVLLVTLIWAWRAGMRPRSGLAALTAALLVFGLGGSLFCPWTDASFLRALSLLVPCLAGFWCSRLLLTTPARQKLFLWFCSVLLGLFLAFCISGYLIFGDVHYYFDEARHPQVNTGMLLLFAPLALILPKQFPQRTIGLLLMALLLVFLFFSGLRTAVLMPLVVGTVALLLGHCSWKQFIIIVVGLAVVIAAFFTFFPEKRLKISGEPAYYRLENYPFSLHIVKKHPIFGIGLRSPRDHFLDDYEIHYPHATKEQFAWTLRRIIVAENIFLTMAVGMGLPFTALFLWFLGLNFKRWIALVRRPPKNAVIPPITAFLALVAAFLHFFIYDGLLHPNVSWLFFALLGLTPLSEDSAKREQSSLSAPTPTATPRASS